MIHKVRKLLVWFGKVFPFVLCAIVCLSYIETLFSISFSWYSLYGDSIVPYKPLSWLFGNIFTYDWHTIIVATILSIAFETCVWNKLSLLYLCVNLYEKEIFIYELYPCDIIAISVSNILISSFLIYKGLKTLA